MRIRLLAPLLAGFVVALALAGFPAVASDASIMVVGDSWSPSTATIQAGESVTWKTDGVGFHNVCVLKPGASGDTCTSANTEFRNGDVSQDWSSYTNSHVFTTPGTYQFFCEAHKSLGMVGTITVQGSSTGTGTGTGTGTSTTPPPDTQPTDTTPTQTQPAADTTAPHFTSKPKRRASRRSLILDFGSSEDGKLLTTVFRRPPGSHRFSRVGGATLSEHKGHNVVTLPRKASGSLRSGVYRVTLQLVDVAGNKSGTKVLLFKLA